MNVPFRALLIAALIAMSAGPAAAEWKAASRFQQRLAAIAIDQTREHVVYDGSYRVIAYPGGDVPRDRGVCADVIIRAYRELGIDLQVLIHEDMAAHFAVYPHDWGLAHPDPNIDHRRVPNLQTFFARNGPALPVSRNPLDYRPGDLVTWFVAGSLPHIGIVSVELNPDGTRPLMVHNIGAGPQLEDMLFDYPVTGHYRYPAAD
ncbi:MAG: DUF1287 domain-containing protein [Alphaproteobacteria bacterium]